MLLCGYLQTDSEVYIENKRPTLSNITLKSYRNERLTTDFWTYESYDNL